MKSAAVPRAAEISGRGERRRGSGWRPRSRHVDGCVGRCGRPRSLGRGALCLTGALAPAPRWAHRGWRLRPGRFPAAVAGLTFHDSRPSRMTPGPKFGGHFTGEPEGAILSRGPRVRRRGRALGSLSRADAIRNRATIPAFAPSSVNRIPDRDSPTPRSRAFVLPSSRLVLRSSLFLLRSSLFLLPPRAALFARPSRPPLSAARAS